MYLWRRLPVDDKETQRILQLMNSLSLAFWLLATLATGYFVIVAYPLSEADWLLYGLVSVSMILVYRLSFSAYHNLAAYWFIISLSLVILIMGVTQPGAAFYLNYLVVPILLSSVFFHAWHTIILIAIYIGLLLIAPSALETLTHEDLPIIFLIVFSVMLKVVTDHRKRVHRDQQAELMDSEERYRSLFTSLSDAVVVLENGVYVDVNESFEHLTGYSREEVIGKSPMDLFIHPDDREIVRERLKTGSETTAELMGIHKSETLIPLEVTGKTYNYHGRSLRVAVLRDITERKTAEKRQFELALERERVRLMKEFINNASHDFRTPLTVLNSSSHLFRLKQDDPKARALYLSRIENQIKHLNNMVENLLSVARLEKASTEKWDFKIGDLNRLIQHQMEEQSLYAETKEVNLRFEPAVDLVHICFDSDEMNRAVRQLITNAINYSSLKTDASVVIRTYQQDELVVVEVQDNGIGMSLDQVSHIFEMFYRIDDARSADTGGLGLGLSICKQVVEVHQGRIEVESTPGKGSTFRILLPIKMAATSA